tara:strand:- start:295 stop:780 length:486 start_codon:yes stop_codon:yes gene_type:complete
MASNLTYGELSIKGCLKLIDEIRPLIKKNSTFIDVGSGYGKLVRMVAEILEIKSIGIEIDKEKHNIALKTNWTNQKKLIEFYNKDFRLIQEKLQNADIIFANNVTWGTDLNDTLLNNSFCNLFTLKKPKNSTVIDKIEIGVTWKPNDSFSWLYKINTNTKR